MVDLSSDQNQSMFKKRQRLSVMNNALMILLSVVNAALAIWALTTNSRSGTFDWAQILLIILPSVIVVLCVIFIVIQIKMYKPYTLTVNTLVSESFEGSPILAEGDAEYEMTLVGDKLAVFRQGVEGAMLIDLSPVKSYTNVCANICDGAKKYLYAYHFAHRGAQSVRLVNKINAKEKIFVITENGEPVKDCTKNYFIKNGLV